MANIGKLTQHFAWILGKIIEYPQGYPLLIITSGILRSDSPSLPWNGGLRNPSMRKSEVQTKQEKLHRIAVECILRRYSCACVIFRNTVQAQSFCWKPSWNRLYCKFHHQSCSLLFRAVPATGQECSAYGGGLCWCSLDNPIFTWNFWIHHDLCNFEIQFQFCINPTVG